MNKKKLFPVLLFAYVLSLAFQDFLRFATTFRKVQLPEILFLLLLITFPWQYFKQYKFDKNDRILIGALSIYWLANVASSIVSGRFSAMAESSGRLYLILLFGMAMLYFQQLSKTELRAKTINVSIILGVFLSLTGIGGIIAHFCGFPSILVGVSEDYPYFGTVYRAQGFTHTPAMLVSLLSFTGIIAATNGEQNALSRRTIIGLLLMIIAAILTFSRSVTFLFWGLFLIFIFKKWGYSRKIFLLTAFLLTVFITLGTHCIFISKTSPDLPALYESPFTSNRILAEQGDYMALETSYLAIKRASIAIWETQPILGIGTGNFMEGMKQMQSSGVYPQKLPIYEAHSTYLGTLAENGIFAAVAVLIFFGLLWAKGSRLNDTPSDLFSIALCICLVSVFIESIALDTMNFRHYWLLFALIWANSKQKSVLY
jgi:O-antigen ligase